MINGIVKDKYNNPIQNATIELKNEHFETILKTNTNKDGFFSIKSTNECKYLIAIKDYRINYLEYWATNINFWDDININLDIIIDKLEIYGLNAFVVNGAYDSIFLYFRPMSLVKYLSNESNICPSIKSIEIKIDNASTSLLGINKVKESIGNEYMNAHLVQVKKDVGKTFIWNKIDVKVIDDDNNVGMASLYNNI